MTQTILGAGGAIGIELARVLTGYNTEIRLVNRRPVKINPGDHLVAADLTKREDVFKAVAGSDVVYVTVGFPYKASVWRELWPAFMKNVIDACLQHNAGLVFFDNVYAIGAGNIHHITENSPISPTSKKGKVRADVDNLIMDNVEKKNLRAIIARAPDFFGGTAHANSIIMNLVYDNLVKGKKAQWFCNAKVVHSMGYVPDLAKGTATLGNEAQAYNQIWNLPTDPQRITGEEWIKLFAAGMGAPDKYQVLPNWLVRSIGLFVPMMSELAEMNYQYDRDYYFDSKKFNQRFGYTPVSNAEAVKRTIDAAGNAINKIKQ